MADNHNLAERILRLEAELQAINDELNRNELTDQARQSSDRRVAVIKDELRKVLDEI